MSTDYSQTLEVALEIAASTAPHSVHDVESIIAYMDIAATTLPDVSDAEREDACTLLFQLSDVVKQACAAHAPREALLDLERPDFPPSVWRDALAGLVDWHMAFCRALPREQGPSTFWLLALGRGQALLQLILWGGPGDLDSVIGVAEELSEACWERGEFGTPLVAMAFQFLGDAHRLRPPGDAERDLEVSARSYQACIRRLSDPADSERISNLAKLCDVATSLVSLGQGQGRRETFAALEELIPHLGEQPPGVEAGRRAQAAVALWKYGERAALMPSERRHLALRSIGLADELLQTPADLTDIARSSLCATLLSAAILLHPWYGVDVVRTVSGSSGGRGPAWHHRVGGSSLVGATTGTGPRPGLQSGSPAPIARRGDSRAGSRPFDRRGTRSGPPCPRRDQFRAAARRPAPGASGMRAST